MSREVQRLSNQVQIMSLDLRNVVSGGNKEYKCEHCGLVINRDKNGARNNLLEKLQELIVNVVNFARQVRRRVAD